MSPLHAAAAALLPEAGDQVVRAILRLLVNELEPAAAPSPRAARSSPPPPTPVRTARKRAARQAAAPNSVDVEWDAVRRQVREAMRDRDTSYADLAAAIGCAATTAKVSLSRRQPPSQPMQDKLRAWLETAPKVGEVAEPAVPFRSISARQHAGNKAIAERRSADGGAAAYRGDSANTAAAAAAG
jgi:hypothetical protein